MHLIDRIQRKIAAGERLDSQDALDLFQSDRLLEIGALANAVNLQKNDGRVFYNVNRHINPTNICVLSCKFCAYSRKPGEEGAYAYTIDEMVQKAGEAVSQGATEVHMVGGLHPRWNFGHYLEMIGAIHQTYPDLHIKAFTVVELDWMARKARKTMTQVLEELVAAGLGSLPGGGAEIFHPEIRDQICDTKVSAEQWLETHKLAHSLGLKSNCTMLYGHIENFFHRVDHMERLRQAQDESGGFNAFIPLSFQPFQNDMGIDHYTYGFDDLKTMAVARLFLDNFQHVKAYWIMLGQDIAQLALQFGANDLDGTVTEEKISRMAGGRAGMAMSRGTIEKIIRKAGYSPVERDTLYNPVHKEAQPAKSLDVQRSGETSTEETAATLAPLHELGAAATKVRDERTGHAAFAWTYLIDPSVPKAELIGDLTAYLETARKSKYQASRIGPTTLALDLATLTFASTESEADKRQGEGDKLAAQQGGVDLKRILTTLWTLKQSFPSMELSIWGFKSLWRLAQDEGHTIEEVLASLREHGVDILESSPNETETDLTHSEIAAIHRTAHSQDIRTVGKAELALTRRGAGVPLWNSFLERLAALDDIARETHGIVSVQVAPDPSSFLTITEYARAVALARLKVTAIEHVAAPFLSIPTLSPRSGLGAKHDQHPAEKVASLMLHFGASDLGHIYEAHVNPESLMQQIRAAGYVPELRDSRFTTLRTADELIWQHLRHVPEEHLLK